MDESMFNNLWSAEKTSHSRSKPQKRMWREIEALKEEQYLRKELAEIDLLNTFEDEELNF